MSDGAILIEKDLMVTTRDGVGLSTDVYRRSDDGRYPTLIQRVPYDKELPSLVNGWFDVIRAVRAGFAVVVQDCRGRYQSAGEFEPFVHEGRDGADTVAWAAAQSWSTGAVAMVGGSYMGATQWLAALEAPPALRAIAPAVTSHQYYDSWIYQNGAFCLGFALHWTISNLAPDTARRMAATSEREALFEAMEHMPRVFAQLPVSDAPELDGPAPYYREWLRHPSFDEYWQRTAPSEGYGRVVVPALNIGGWYDVFLKGTLANYRGMRARGGSAEARTGQRLVIGPWAHGAQTGWFPERFFGVTSGTESADLTGLQLQWLRERLAPEPTGPSNATKPVRLFVMGIDRWRDEDDWPLPDTRFTDFYLHSAGRANTAGGDGVLDGALPGDEPPDRYSYDPRDPVPTVGGAAFLPGHTVAANSGPRDQRAVEGRPDVLCYTSAPMVEALEVTGSVELHLFVSSDRLDTDFTGKLVDVHPDGRSENLCEGILRCRYRNSASRPELLEPGTVYELTVDLVATSNVFRPGHRIRLQVSSSNFPRFARNGNSGGDPAGETEADFVVANNQVFHDRVRPSRIVLPVIPRR
jgi:uncharacterized protein